MIQQKLTPRQLGLIFLIPGLFVSVPTLIMGTFKGAAMGFGTFAVIFGSLMILMSLFYREKN